MPSNLYDVNEESNMLKIVFFSANAGFEMGIRDMKPGGRRRIIIPPELGPPVSSYFLYFTPFLTVNARRWLDAI